MTEAKFNPEDMPILNLNTSGTSRFEASRFLDSPEAISAYLAESMKENDPELLMQALSEVAKAQGVNKVAKEAGVNRESLYKTFKGGVKTRYETIRKLMEAVGVELTVQPIAAKAAAAGWPNAQPRMAAKAAAPKAPARPAAAKASAKPAGKVASKPRAATRVVDGKVRKTPRKAQDVAASA
jgi:probable addiction module antidote protein